MTNITQSKELKIASTFSTRKILKVTICFLSLRKNIHCRYNKIFILQGRLSFCIENIQKHIWCNISNITILDTKFNFKLTKNATKSHFTTDACFSNRSSLLSLSILSKPVPVKKGSYMEKF